MTASLEALRDAAARIDRAVRELELGEQMLAVDSLLDLRDELLVLWVEERSS